jgi:hypothetical protein
MFPLSTSPFFGRGSGHVCSLVLDPLTSVGSSSGARFYGSLVSSPFTLFGFDELSEGFGVSPLHSSQVSLGSLLPAPISLDFSDPSVPGSFAEGLSAPTTCSGDFLDVATTAPSPFLQGFQDLDAFFWALVPSLTRGRCDF